MPWPPSSCFEGAPYKHWGSLPSSAWSGLPHCSHSCPSLWLPSDGFSQLVQESLASANLSPGSVLLVQPNSFLKISCDFFSPIRIYKALEIKYSDLPMSIPLLAPRALGKLGWAFWESVSYEKLLGTCWPNHLSPPSPRRHRISLEQRAPCWSCWHCIIRAIFFWFLIPGNAGPLTLPEPGDSLFPGNSSGNL